MSRSDGMKRLDILLAVIVVVLAAIIGLLVYDRQHSKVIQKENEMIAWILSEKSAVDKKNKDKAFIKEFRVHGEMNEMEFVKERAMLGEDEYDILVLSNWGANFSNELFSKYFVENTLVSSANISTPEDIGKYLEAALVDGSRVTRVFINLDPYSLEKGYYRNHRFENGALTYLQMMNQCFWQYISEYSDVTFYICLPVFSVSKLENYSMQKVADYRYSCEQFVKLSSRYSNVRMCSLGMEEWFVIEEDFFDELTGLSKEGAEQLLLLQIGGDEFLFDYNEFDEKWTEYERVIGNMENDGVSRCDWSDMDVVFLGDSIMTYRDSYGLNPPGMFENLTHARVYNAARGGSSIVLRTSGFSFKEQLDRILTKGYKASSDALLFETESERFANDDHSDRKLLFVIEFGFNDYAPNSPIGTPQDTTSDTFAGGLNEGIARIKEAYPKADILIVSAPYIALNKGGSTPYSGKKGDNTLSQYVLASKKCAGVNKVSFLNAYTDMNLNEKNVSEYYTSDGIHPNCRGAYLLTKKIIKAIQGMIK